MIWHIILQYIEYRTLMIQGTGSWIYIPHRWRVFESSYKANMILGGALLDGGWIRCDAMRNRETFADQ